MLRACQNPPRRNVCGIAIASPVFTRLSAFEGLFGDPRARVIALTRRSKKRRAVTVVAPRAVGMTANCAECGISLVEVRASTLSSISAASAAGAAKG
jgi:hypothetical protein